MILFGWGDDPNHEALVTDILATYDGDAITDAELTFESIPAILYNQGCARVAGTVVRKSVAAPKAQSPAPATVPPPAAAPPVTTPPQAAPAGEAQ